MKRVRVRAPIVVIKTAFPHLPKPIALDFLDAGVAAVFASGEVQRYEDMDDFVTAMAVTLVTFEAPIPYWTVEDERPSETPDPETVIPPHRELVLQPDSMWPGMERPVARRALERFSTKPDLRKTKKRGPN